MLRPRGGIEIAESAQTGKRICRANYDRTSKSHHVPSENFVVVSNETCSHIWSCVIKNDRSVTALKPCVGWVTWEFLWIHSVVSPRRFCRAATRTSSVSIRWSQGGTSVQTYIAIVTRMLYSYWDYLLFIAK